ncbi:hypothetical protein D3C71_1107890 [compost metagenome]
MCEGIYRVRMVAARVDCGGIDPLRPPAGMGVLLLPQEVFGLDPHLHLSWVTEEHPMVDGPHLATAPDTPNAGLKPVVLGIHAAQEQQAVAGHRLQWERLRPVCQLICVGPLDLPLPGLTQSGVGPGLQLAVVALLVLGVSLQELANDLLPGDCRAVCSPDVKSDVSRSWNNLVVRRREAAIGPKPDVAARVYPFALLSSQQVLTLRHGVRAERAEVVDVDNAASLVALELEPVRFVLPTPR